MCKHYSREQLIEYNSYTKVLGVENLVHYLLFSSSEYIVFSWKKAPRYIKSLCCEHGGDEEWVVVTRNISEDIPYWIEKMGDLHRYDLNGVVIFVAAH